MVVAATEQQFGSAETNITARLPLMVRPSAPRFLNFGDHIQLPVVVQNQTDEPLAVDVVVQTANLKLEGDQGLRVTVPANDRVEVRFPATTDNVGTAQRPDCGDSRRLCRCSQHRPARLHAGHHGSLCDLRRDRRRQRGPARGPAAGRLPAIRRARNQHLLHSPPDPHRRDHVPASLSLRVLGATRFPGHERRFLARCVDRIRGTRHAQASGDRRGHEAATSTACKTCRTSTAAGPSGRKVTNPGRTIRSSSPTRWSLPAAKTTQ